MGLDGGCFVQDLDRLGFWWGDPERYMDLRWDVFIGTFYYWFKFTHMPMVRGVKRSN